MLRLAVDERLSSPGAGEAIVADVRLGCVGDADPDAAAWRHAPVLHYRALTGPLDSLTTDTPLLLFHRWRRHGGRLALEYHVIFSHEDAGTDLAGLLACWGHTVDIEWVFRVTFDDAGQVLAEELQGPHHVTLPYRGGRAMGGHPVVQVATLNGTFSDHPTCPYRVALAPACAQPAGEPREGVLQRFPWIYRVSAQEVLRQVPLESPPSADSPAPADPRSYVFLQWHRRGGPAVPLEAGVRVGNSWYTSAWGRRALGFTDPDAESTAVKVPAGTTEEGIAAIALHALAAPAEPAEVRLVRAFVLDEDFRPRRPFTASGSSADCRLTARAPRCVAWQRRAGSQAGGVGILL